MHPICSNNILDIGAPDFSLHLSVASGSQPGISQESAFPEDLLEGVNEKGC